MSKIKEYATADGYNGTTFFPDWFEHEFKEILHKYA